MARIDVDTADAAIGTQSHDAVIVAAVATTPRLPAVHPLAMVVVFVGNEDGRRIGDHALLRRKELVACRDRSGAEPRRSEIGIEARESGVAHSKPIATKLCRRKRAFSH